MSNNKKTKLVIKGKSQKKAEADVKEILDNYKNPEIYFNPETGEIIIEERR